MLSEAYNQKPESEVIFDKITEGDKSYVEAYIARGADLTTSDPENGNNLLFYAIFCGQKDIARMLIPAIGHEDVARTFILLCGRNHSLEWITELLPIIEGDKETLINALLEASRFNRIENVKFLLDSGKVTASDKDQDGISALMIAGGSKSKTNVELFELLLEQGADINDQTLDGTSILKFAFSSCYQPLSDSYLPDFTKIQWLISKDVKVAAEDIESAKLSGNRMLVGVIEDYVEAQQDFDDLSTALRGLEWEVSPTANPMMAIGEGSEDESDTLS